MNSKETQNSIFCEFSFKISKSMKSLFTGGCEFWSSEGRFDVGRPDKERPVWVMVGNVHWEFIFRNFAIKGDFKGLCSDNPFTSKTVSGFGKRKLVENRGFDSQF